MKELMLFRAFTFIFVYVARYEQFEKCESYGISQDILSTTNPVS